MFTSPDTQGYPQWLQVIHAVNDIRPGTFLDPDSVGPRADGCYVEEYPTARVVFPPEEARLLPVSVVTVEGKTPEVEGAIWLAAKRLGFTS